MFTDVSKMFDPTAATQMMQKFWDVNQFSSTTQKNTEAYQKLTSCTAETVSSCYQKLAQMCQSNLQNSIEYMRELSTAKSLEDITSKQAEWTKKCAQTCQSNAQDLAETMQKGQSQCTDIITRMMADSAEFAASSSKKAANAVSSAASGKNS